MTAIEAMLEQPFGQAVGWALYERVAWAGGRMQNAQMTNYIMPTSMDLPPIRVVFEEVPYVHGPSGAQVRFTGLLVPPSTVA